MIEARAMVQYLALESYTPRELLIRTNRKIFPDAHKMKNPMLMTMIITCWDKR